MLKLLMIFHPQTDRQTDRPHMPSLMIFHLQTPTDTGIHTDRQKYKQTDRGMHRQTDMMMMMTIVMTTQRLPGSVSWCCEQGVPTLVFQRQPSPSSWDNVYTTATHQWLPVLLVLLLLQLLLLLELCQPRPQYTHHRAISNNQDDTQHAQALH